MRRKLFTLHCKSRSDYFKAHGWNIWRVTRSLGGKSGPIKALKSLALDLASKHKITKILNMPFRESKIVL